jgi:predicted ATPase
MKKIRLDYIQEVLKLLDKEEWTASDIATLDKRTSIIIDEYLDFYLDKKERKSSGNLYNFDKIQREYHNSGFSDFKVEEEFKHLFQMSFSSLLEDKSDETISWVKKNLKNIFQMLIERYYFTNRPTNKHFQTPSLPYALRYFQIHQFQCIKNIAAELPSDAQFIVFTGENGDGKTSILQGLSMGFYNSRALTEEERGFPNSLIQVQYETEKGNIHNEICNNPNIPILYSLKDKIQELPAFAAYSAARLDTKDKVEIHNPLLNLFNTGKGQLLDIFMIWLKEISANEPEKFEAVVKVLLSLLPNISAIKKVYPERVVSDFVFVEKGVEVPLKHLSAGHKSIVLMIGDMIIRLANAQPEVQNPNDFEGIVMIDELEAHLHPKWQKAFPKILAETFPKVQFIVTTHSAICLLGMPENTVFFKVSRTEKEGTTIEKIDIELENLTPNLILTSPIFGLENVFSTNHEAIKSISTADNFDEIEARLGAKSFVRELIKKQKTTHEKG